MGPVELQKRMKLGEVLKLEGLEKLTTFNGNTFSSLPRTIQLALEMRPLKVITLSDKSDPIVRYDLFERLNRGGVMLTNQEVRDCVFRGPLAEAIAERLAEHLGVEVMETPVLIHETKTGNSLPTDGLIEGGC